MLIDFTKEELKLICYALQSESQKGPDHLDVMDMRPMRRDMKTLRLRLEREHHLD